MAATETTQDAVIVIPPKNQDKIEVVTTETGTAVIVSEATKKVSFEVEEDGKVATTGAAISKAIFTFTGSGTVEITNDAIKDSKILGDSGDNAVSIGSSSLPVDTAAKDVKIKAGEGSDTVTVAASVAKNIKVDLGSGNDADNVTIETDLNDIKNMKIKNFGKEDTFTFKGQTFTFKDLKNDNPFSPNITFDFS